MIETVFGSIAVPNPRWEHCQMKSPKKFRLTATWLKGRTNLERLYFAAKWGSLIPYEKVADLLKEVPPVSESTNHEIVQEHLRAVAERIETELTALIRWLAAQVRCLQSSFLLLQNPNGLLFRQTGSSRCAVLSFD